MKNRVLLITYFFPPYNPTECRRSLNITRAVVRAGWDIDVLAPLAKDYHSKGSYSKWRDLFNPEDIITIHRVTAGLHEILPTIVAAVKCALKLLRLKRIFCFPDKCVSWLFFLIPQAIWLVRKRKPDIVITSSYPYSAHVAGLVISLLFRIPWIVDTRDGWAVDDSEQFLIIEPSFIYRKLHKLLMCIIMKRATQVWSITPGIRDATVGYFSGQNPNKFVTVVQGYETRKVSKKKSLWKSEFKNSQKSKKFIIGYAGRFRSQITPAETMIEALSILKKQHTEWYSKILICIWGLPSKTADPYLGRLISEYNVEDCFEFHTTVSEDSLTHVLSKCDALLITNGSSKWSQKRLTTKLFVYLTTGIPLISICEQQSDIATYVRASRVGIVVGSDSKKVATLLLNCLQSNSLAEVLSFKPNWHMLENFSLQNGVMPLMAAKIMEATCLYEG